jgi:hypothetical protein
MTSPSSAAVIRPQTAGTVIHRRPPGLTATPSSDEEAPLEIEASDAPVCAFVGRAAKTQTNERRTDAITLAPGKNEPILCMAVSDAKKGTWEKWNCTQGTASFAD